MRTEEAALQYRFGDFVLDVRNQRLSRVGADTVSLTGKPFTALLYLIEHAGAALSKDALGGHLGQFSGGRKQFEPVDIRPSPAAR